MMSNTMKINGINTDIDRVFRDHLWLEKMSFHNALQEASEITAVSGGSDRC